VIGGAQQHLNVMAYMATIQQEEQGCLLITERWPLIWVFVYSPILYFLFDRNYPQKCNRKKKKRPQWKKKSDTTRNNLLFPVENQ